MKKGKTKSSSKRTTAGRRPTPAPAVPSGHQVFCTECGATLENFCFSGAADDVESIRKTLAQCRKQGRFSGDFCSKLFIAHPEAASEPIEDPGDDPDPGTE